jgi:thiamine biosynthesis lipoprotein
MNATLPSSYNYSFPAMGSDCRVTLYADDEHTADHAADAVMAEVWRIERKYSRYADDSVLSAINRAGLAGGRVEVDSETAGLLDYAFAAHRQSGGLFDVSCGALARVWDFSRAVLPAQSAIAAILPLVGLDKLNWSPPRLEFLRAGMALDFGGIGKEYAVDRAADICLALGIRSGMIDFGGDIRVLGPHPDGAPWRIGVRHPRMPEVSLGTIEVMSGALATSGDYERYIEVAGRRYCHILNPVSGWPAAGFCSVTVLAEQCLLAGTLATIAMLKEESGKQWLIDSGFRHLWIDAALDQGGTIQLA